MEILYYDYLLLVYPMLKYMLSVMVSDCINYSIVGSYLALVFV